MAPVVEALRGEEWAECRVCATGQHRTMLRQAMEVFGYGPDFRLGGTAPDLPLALASAKVLAGLQKVFDRWRPRAVLVQGDTTTAAAAALAAFYNRIDVLHVEAGLRTDDPSAPWPEEMNRRVVGRIARLHFAPSEGARENLLRENVPAETVHVTGNTGIDALFMAAKAIDSSPEIGRRLERRFAGILDDTRRLVLTTCHRRENFGRGLSELCSAMASLAERDDVYFVYPVHLNPNVRGPATAALSGRRNIHLLDPVDYFEFVHLMRRSHVLLTDSGGIQEEGPSLGKPVLLMRGNSERPEALAGGSAVLVPAERDAIIGHVEKLLDDQTAYDNQARISNPYGDGKAAPRIAGILRDVYARAAPPEF